MNKLPTQYAWLGQEPGPKLLIEALKLYGTAEKSGPGNNPAILAWAQECGLRGYGTDATPWCGLFVAVCAHRAGKPLPESPLWARGWATWGEPSSKPALGDVLVFRRDNGGHVGLYVGEDGLAYHVLGGNQGDAVSIRRIAKNRLIAARRLYAVGPPANVRTIRLAASGTLSNNEA